MADPAREKQREALNTTALILMGVSGCGKTTIGQVLAQQLGWTFADADTFHSAANIAKMAQGIPLSDDDRAPWLAALADFLKKSAAEGSRVVLACSALKEAYREKLKIGPGVQFVYLEVSRSILEERLKNRKGHFFDPALLDSQLQTLEIPREALVINANADVQTAVREILRGLNTNHM